MPLTRTDTAILLESDDGNFYWVTLADVGDPGEPAYTPVADASDPQADDGSDGYVALLADDAVVYRWSLLEPDAENHIGHKFEVSPDQGETTATSITIQLDGDDYAVSLIVTDGDIISHMVEFIQPLIVATSEGGGRKKRRRYGYGYDWWWNDVPQPVTWRDSPTFDYYT